MKLTVPMPGAELWSPETPRLYRCRVLLQQSGKTVDAKDVLFGYRSFGLVSKQYPRAGLQEGTPLLNGKAIYFYGTVDGAFNLNWFWRQEDKIVDALLMLKAANFNAIHPCQHVNFPEVLELYDRLGFMSQQDQGALHNADRKRAFPQLVHTGAVLARQCYNNPGVVLLCFGNETHFEPREVLDAALAVDPERIIVPISGHGNNHLPPGYKLPEQYWANIIDDFHAYFGWYPAQAQPWAWSNIYRLPRLMTVGEYGAEALDSYETMRRFPPSLQPVPPPNADVLCGTVEVQKCDAKQIVGFRGKRPANLGEYIEASQNYQADVLAENTTGFRISPQGVSGYFQFYFIEPVPVYWIYSIVSFDFRPKKGYFTMAQLNQPLAPLFRLTGKTGDALELWVSNNLDRRFDRATLSWKVQNAGKTFSEGRCEPTSRAERPAGEDARHGLRAARHAATERFPRPLGPRRPGAFALQARRSHHSLATAGEALATLNRSPRCSPSVVNQ